MAKFDSAEKLNLADIEITDVMTGDRDKRMFLYYQLIHSLKKAERVDIIVSFLMESGVKMLLRELGNALDSKNSDPYRKLFGDHPAISIVSD